MFVVYCSGHRSQVLLSTESIEEVVNRPDGVELRWCCTCGTTGRTHMRGRPISVAGAA
ncbi:MAG: hypothetical protein M3083_08105 [Actinomycetota bacterium]|nr:hypothetical protein [Actinomycetota bacterium]